MFSIILGRVYFWQTILVNLGYNDTEQIFEIINEYNKFYHYYLRNDWFVMFSICFNKLF